MTSEFGCGNFAGVFKDMKKSKPGYVNERARILAHLRIKTGDKNVIGVNYNRLIRLGRTADAAERYARAAEALEQDGLILIALPWYGAQSRVLVLTSRGEKAAEEIERDDRQKT